MAGKLARSLTGMAMLLVMAAAAWAQSATALHVHVVNLRDSNGQVICTLYNSPLAFPSDSNKAVGQLAVPLKADSAVCSFGGLAPGKYALVAFHDENDNGKFDENAIGMPEEGYAFSNGVKPTFSKPGFDECAFQYNGGGDSITISMIY